MIPYRRVLFLLSFYLQLMLATAGIPVEQDRQNRSIGPGTQPVDLQQYSVVYYVSNTNGSDETGDGSSNAPWQTLQMALQKIKDAGKTKRYAVLVSAGEYDGSPFQMQEFVDLYGGFESQSGQRDISKNQSVLTGSGERRVLIGANNARLDGFVIQNGHIRGKGAGLFCDNASPVITNNIFLGNKTLKPVPWNPKHWHETAHDGAAIYCQNSASPIIENNLFTENATENGRGAAVALHGNCSPGIAYNVFLNNTTGLDDPARSSDGGAVSVFDWSGPVIENNIFLGNRSLAKNDGGGMFVALWSSPVIRRNIFVANVCGDDAGALFVGGQEHRYDTPFDPLPPAEKFFIKISENTFIGNANPSQNSGAMRFTMESRGEFVNNIVAHNTGIYFQRSEVAIRDNLILDNFLFVETKEGLKPGIIENNIIWGEFDLETEATVKNNNIRIGFRGKDNFSKSPLLVHDSMWFISETSAYYKKKFTTTLHLSHGNFKENELANRVVKSGNKWSIVKSNDEKNIEIWGDFTGEVMFSLLPTYRLLRG